MTDFYFTSDLLDFLRPSPRMGLTKRLAAGVSPRSHASVNEERDARVLGV